MNTEKSKPILANSFNETVRRTSLCRQTLYKLIEDGTLESIKIGGRRLILERSLRKLIEGDRAERDAA